MIDPPDEEMEALAESLEWRFRTIVTPLTVAGRALEVVHPASAEDLIDEHEFERDERLPYWAELWPSARVLAAWVLGTNGAGLSALELGCGAGLVATGASLAGYDVLATDYYEDALRFTRVNAWRNGAPIPRARLLDWRSLPAERESFDLVLASDVLYERPYGLLVAETIDAFLSDRGRAIIADPGRVAREDFLAASVSLGLRVHAQVDVPYTDGAVKQTIGLFELRRRG